jgi:hypothetical protein
MLFFCLFGDLVLMVYIDIGFFRDEDALAVDALIPFRLSVVSVRVLTVVVGFCFRRRTTFK